ECLRASQELFFANSSCKEARVVQMFKSYVLAGGLILLSITAHAESTEEMVSACRGIAEEPTQGFAQGPQGNVRVIKRPQDYQSALCWGAFASIQNVVNLTWPDEKKPLLDVCVPPGITRTQLIKEFLRYANEHPEGTHEEFMPAVLA